MASHSKMTTDHDEIRQWVEKHGGKPSTVKATHHGDDPGLLRIDFPGYSGEDTLEEISWDDFFEKFDESDLVFLYQDETADGHESRFSKLISAVSAAEMNESGGGSASSSGGSRSNAAATKKSTAAKKKAPAKKAAAAKKAPAKKVPAKQAPAKKVAAKKVAAKKAPAKKTAVKKAAVATKKTAAKKKAPAKKTAAKKRR